MAAKMLAPGLYDLGQWKPNMDNYVYSRRGNNPLVIKRFIKIPAINGELLYPELRGASFNAGDLISHWHKDMANNTDLYILVWASIHPTEIKPSPVKLKPWRIFAIDNETYEHRTPAQANGSGRWFARAYVRKGDFVVV